MSKKTKNIKRVFLSATYDDLTDLIEEIKSKLAAWGIKVVHFKNPDFHSGQTNIHRHDICLKYAKNIPNYLLIVDRRAGENYKGKNSKYRGLAITHAEFKAAYKATKGKNKNKRKMYIFIRKNCWNNYQLWKKTSRRNRSALILDVEPKVFQLLEDIEKKGTPWIILFEHSLEFKKVLKKKKCTFK